MAGKFSNHVRDNVIGYLALFVALSGTAWAATELEKNEVKSKHIGKGQVKSADLGKNSVTSPKVADGSLLGADFAPGQLPAGEPGDTGPPGQDASAPTGAVTFFNLATCPSGWSELTAARGRYLVGLQPSGTRGGTVGIALTDAENRAVGQHNHGITDPEHTHRVRTAVDGGFASGSDKLGLVEGDPTFATSPSTSTATTGITVNNAGAVAGTNAPYLQLLVCQKN